jgi:ligand-binding SRPBCC domain-containing protein
MSVQSWKSALWLARPREEIFQFFSDARNLAVITPPSLQFQITTPEAIVMERGRLIDYRVRILGVAMRWQSRITVWNPPISFADTQTRGPYRS